jgi:hypothetical protein
MGGYTTSVSGQRLGKHVPTATNRRAATDVLLETECFCVVMLRCYKQRARFSSAREFVKRGLETGGRGIAIVEAVTRKRLVTD